MIIRYEKEFLLKNFMVVLCLALAGCAAFLAGCAPKSMTIEDFRGKCLASATGDCLPSGICEKYTEVLREDYGDAVSCRQACEETLRAHQRQDPMGGDCAAVYEKAQGFCNEYCNQHYWR
jgi:hypothetical protein